MKRTLRFWLLYVGLFLALLLAPATGFAADSELAKVDFTIAENISPKQYITVPFTLAGFSKRQTLISQLLLDEMVIATNSFVSKETASTDSQIRATVPESVTDGEHSITLRVLSGSNLVAQHSELVSVSLPNLTLKANGRVLKPTDSIILGAGETTAWVEFATETPQEIITTIVTPRQTHTVDSSSYRLSVSLDKSETETYLVYVTSASRAQEKVYTLMISRSSDVTSIDASVLAESGNEYYATLSDGSYEIFIPTSEHKGKLCLKTQDPLARIQRVGETSYNSKSIEHQFSLPDGGDLLYDVVVSTGTHTSTYTVHITNANYTPFLAIANASEIIGATFTSSGVMRNSFIEYGKLSTSVNEAQISGKTHGLVLKVEASDLNVGQYLAGALNMNGEKHPIHWGSFDGPTFIQTGDPIQGYIYIDSAYFRSNLPMSSYTLTLSDYNDALLREALSSTSVSISFAVAVSAGNFSAYFDQSSSQILMSTTSQGAFSYRKSLDSGVTWSEPLAATDTITVVDSGISLYEITLTDDMKNTTSKLLTVSMPEQGDEIGVNVFLSTTRRANYTYLNTKKSNVDSMDLGLFGLFTQFEVVAS